MEQEDIRQPESDQPLKELWTGVKKLFFIIVAILISVIVVVVVVSIFSSGKGAPTSTVTPTQQKTHTDIEAYVASQQILEKFLKAPSTAKYPSFTDAKVTTYKDNGFEVSAYVDSQNSFGAMIRSNWTVYLRFEGESANPLEVIVDDKVVYKNLPSE